MKDKSAWRKSNLNVANSSEATKDESRHRHTLPRSTHSYADDNDRKGLISSLGERPPTDKLTLYICQPNASLNNTSRSTLDSVSPCTRSSQQSLDQAVSNKVEIDQDNIETPPATRRIFTPTPVDKREPVQPNPCRRFMGRSSRDSLVSPDEPEASTILGDGQFDRFSATRRTRRYKRNTENAEVTSPELVAEKEIIKPNVFNVETSSPVSKDSVMDRETRLQAWKERLKTQNDPSGDLKTRRNRHQTNINQEDIKKALNLAIPTSPISIANMDVPVTDEKRTNSTSSTYINSETSNKIDISNRKTKEHDNDEGFEETQSLMSESPSQGASSGGNYETDMVDTTHVVVADFNKSKPKRVSSLELKNVSTSDISKPNRSTAKGATTNQITNQKSIRNFDRNSSLRQTTQEISKNKSVIPRRSGSLRKTGSQSSVNNKKSNVQRSGSRNSIVSSRSSLNSATSSSTVKRIPLKTNSPSTISKPAQKAPNNKLLNVNVKSSNSTKRSLVSNNALTTQKPPRPSLSSFMKPTTSSATKSTVIPSRMQTSNFRSKH